MLDDEVGDYAARTLALRAATSYAKRLVLLEDVLQLPLVAANATFRASSQVGRQHTNTLCARCIVHDEDA